MISVYVHGCASVVMRKQWWLVEEHEAQMSLSSEHEFKG